MQQYLELLSRIYTSGQPKHPTRDGTPTRNATVGLPNLHFSHDLSTGFPLLTTRKLAWNACVGELRSFLDGCTNNAEFQARGCNLWSRWARDGGKLGPVYGAQWRRFDQLQRVLQKLRSDPTDRRMVVSAWLPDQIPAMCLPPCHLLWVATPYGGKLNLCWVQRSCDFPLGVPYNIASYALLTHILAAWAGMQPGRLDCVFCDAHIYANQMGAVAEQLKRSPRRLPAVFVSFDDSDNFSSWQCELTGYGPHPALDLGDPEV